MTGCARSIFVPSILVFILTLSIPMSPVLAEKSEDEELAEIRKMIEEKGYHWSAGKTSVSWLSLEEKRMLCGCIPASEADLAQMPAFVPTGAAIIDSIFDWRALGCVTPAKDQLGCGSCWIFAPVGELESHMLIYDARYEDLSEQMVLSCHKTAGDCCRGGKPWETYKFIMKEGIADEACMPYGGSTTIDCEFHGCNIIANMTWYESVLQDVDVIKEALLRGPVTTGFDVYYNFYYYQDGCYEGPSGTYIGRHAVVIVGWSDKMCSGEGAWLCKNSWGEDWGMDGFFYIKYDCCDIGRIGTQIVYEQSPAKLTIAAPNGGETFIEGSDCNISWIVDRHRAIPDAINIYMSIDGGARYPYLVVENFESGSSFVWKTPTIPTGKARVLIEAVVDGVTGGMDTSNDIFTIEPDYLWPEVTVLYPNGGETFAPGDTVCIEWIATDNAGIDSVNIYYSEYGSYVYIPIAVGEEFESPYCWVVPEDIGDECIVKITAYDPSLWKDTDLSDDPFYIDQTVTGEEPEGPPAYTNRLEQNYPNPFNGTTTIAYSVAERCDVTVRIYDTAGKLVRILERMAREPGRYETVWRGTDAEGRAVASGVYFCSIDAGPFEETRKIVYLR